MISKIHVERRASSYHGRLIIGAAEMVAGSVVAYVWIDAGWRIDNAREIDSESIHCHDGWNGSYHDCQYGRCAIAAVGRSAPRAAKRLRKAIAAARIVSRMDASAQRYEARRAVREGD